MKAILPNNETTLAKTIGFLRRGYSKVGGAEVYLKRLARGLLEQGYRVLLLNDGAWPKEDWPGGETIFFPQKGCSSLAQEALELKRRGIVDLLFSLERIPGCDLFRAGDGVHAAWLKHRQEREPAWKSFFTSLSPHHRRLLALERKLFSPNSTTRIIANSSMVAQEIENHFHFPADRISIIPNGVPPKPLLTMEERHAAREALGIKPGEFILLFVGSGWKRKGGAIALEVLKQIEQEEGGENLHLWIVGKGTPQKSFSQRIRFWGATANIEPLYRAADLFILPTLYDPFSNASLEALLFGLPVITTAFNGCAEILKEGVHGSVMKNPNDVEAFRKAVLHWQRRLESDEQSVLRAACHQRALSLDMELNLKRTRELIEQVLQEKR